MIGEPEFKKIQFLIVGFIVASVSNDKELKSLIEKFIKNILFEIPHAQHKLFKNISEAQTWFTS